MIEKPSAAGVQQPVIRPVLQCVCGGQGGGDVRLVRMRVPGKATKYQANTVALCVTCRRAERGKWMHVDRSG